MVRVTDQSPPVRKGLKIQTQMYGFCFVCMHKNSQIYTSVWTRKTSANQLKDKGLCVSFDSTPVNLTTVSTTLHYPQHTGLSRDGMNLLYVLYLASSYVSILWERLESSESKDTLWKHCYAHPCTMKADSTHHSTPKHLMSPAKHYEFPWHRTLMCSKVWTSKERKWSFNWE